MNKVLTGFLVAILCFLMLCVIGVSGFFSCTATGKRIWNDYWHDVKQADDNTRYENRKEVEDTKRLVREKFRLGVKKRG